MALYWPVTDEDGLLDALADHVVGQVDRTCDPALDRPDQLRALLRSLLSVLRAHPGAAGPVGPRNSTSEASLELIEVALRVLDRGGWSASDAAILDLLAALPADRFRHVVAAAAPLASCPDRTRPTSWASTCWCRASRRRPGAARVRRRSRW